MKYTDRKTMTVAEVIAALQAIPQDYPVWATIKAQHMRGRVGERVGGGASGPIKEVKVDHDEHAADLVGIEDD